MPLAIFFQIIKLLLQFFILFICKSILIYFDLYIIILK